MIARLALPQVTLISVASLDIDKSHAALLHCARHIDFGAIKMVCSSLPASTTLSVEYLPIPELDYLGYQRFMIESLNGYIQTDYCLVVQADGFILDPARWNDRFLDYDYIGAPWAEVVAVGDSETSLLLNLDKNRVGNGGFSLRSKKPLEATSLVSLTPLISRRSRTTIFMTT